MATDNKSPSYLAERERVRRWLLGTPDGRVTRDLLIKNAPHGDASKILDDDQHVDWEELVREHHNSVMVMASCKEAREAFELSKQSTSTLGPPGLDKQHMLRIASIPTGYWLRREAETGDPEYWKNPENLYREILNNPQWSTVSTDHIRGGLEKHLPRQRQPRPDPVIKPALTMTEPKPDARIVTP